MKNYVYIVASLPVVNHDYKFTPGSVDDITESILSQLDSRDRSMAELLLRGTAAQDLDADFYREVLSCGNRFMREYFTFDLNLRNAKVNYLNVMLGRDPGKDVVVLDPDAEAPEFEEYEDLQSVLETVDLLGREKALDDFVARKIDSITTFDYFTLDVILGFLAKLSIYSRWFLLDEEAGREKFKSIVDELINKAQF